MLLSNPAIPAYAGSPRFLPLKACRKCAKSAVRRHFLLLAKRPLDIALRVLLGRGFTLVVVLLAFAETDETLGVAVANVHLKRHDRVAFLLGLAVQLVNLRFVHEQLARPRRVGRIEPVALGERADMHVMQENLAVPDRREGVVQVRAAAPKRLDLRAGQHHARLEGFFDEVIVRRFLVLSKRFVVLVFLPHENLHLLRRNDVHHPRKIGGGHSL